MNPDQYLAKRWHSSAMLLIGGSAGSFKIMQDVIQVLPQGLNKAVVMVMHRARNYQSELTEMFGRGSLLAVREISDKDVIEKGIVYLAPANYHTLIEKKGFFSLDVSDPVWCSKPSIDVTFESAADSCGGRCTAVLLSGANPDGAKGLLRLKQAGALTIAQDPQEAEMPDMPQAAIDCGAADYILTTTELLDLLRS